MAGRDELTDFVRDALGRGVPRAEIEAALQAAGWPRARVQAAVRAFADVAFPVPVPRPRPYLSAREAFFYLLLFTSLYISAWYLGSLLFDIINHLFPDPATQRYPGWAVYERQSIRWAISFLIVAFPVYLYVAWFLGREERRDSDLRNSKVRRWLTYLTIFIAVGALIGDVTTLVYHLLGGELTIRFVLKILVVAVIAGTTFWYYLVDLRPEERDA